MNFGLRGPLGGHLGALVGRLGGLLGRLEAILGVLERSWAVSVLRGTVQETILGSPGRLGMAGRGPRNRKSEFPADGSAQGRIYVRGGSPAFFRCKNIQR